MIYFLEAVGVGNIKIGFTDSLDASDRLSDLQTGSPVPLRLLGTIPGTMADEKDLHRRFASALACGREWFKPVPELLALIAPKEPLACGKIEVVEQSVQIRVLTVGRKQFTKTLVEQLSGGSFLPWSRIHKILSDAPDLFSAIPEIEVASSPGAVAWGWLKFARAENPVNLLIFERAGILYKEALFDIPYDAAYPGGRRPSSSGGSTKEEFRFGEAIDQVWMKFQQHWFTRKHQLFIGV